MGCSATYWDRWFKDSRREIFILKSFAHCRITHTEPVVCSLTTITVDTSARFRSWLRLYPRFTLS